MTPELATAIILGLGGPLVIPKIADAIKTIRSGEAAREKRRNRSALDLLDSESSYRRRIEEYASRLRRMLIDLGVPEEKLPQWPERNPRRVRS